MIKISEETTEFDFGSLLKKEKTKEEQKDLELKSKSVIPKVVRDHPIVKGFTAMMDAEVENINLGMKIIDKIDFRWDFDSWITTENCIRFNKNH